MKLCLPLLLSATVFMSACASNTTPVVEAPSIDVQDMNKKKGPVNLTSSSKAEKDISSFSSWKAVELMWPETPYMTLTTPEDRDVKGQFLSFNCNTDTGAISGNLHAQSSIKAGKAASFTLRTSDGEAMTLLGMSTNNISASSSEFVFKTDWNALKAISNSERVDIIGADGQSQIALVKKNTPHRGDTQILASSDDFEAALTKLYYYCNPK